MAKLSKEDFEFFKQECKRWVHFLGIFQWDYRFLFENDNEALARIHWDVEGGIVAFTLARHWGKDEINDYNLSKTAFHEVCELLLYELNDMARQSNRDTITDGAIHRVIRKLENTVFEYEWLRNKVS